MTGHHHGRRRSSITDSDPGARQAMAERAIQSHRHRRASMEEGAEQGESQRTRIAADSTWVRRQQPMVPAHVACRDLTYREAARRRND
jgi:hypothetical protein